MSFETLLVNTPTFKPIFELLDENKPAVQIGISQIDSALKKCGFEQGSLNVLECTEILFDGVFCDLVRQTAKSGKKICIYYTPQQKELLKETFKNAALDFDCLKGSDSIISFEQENSGDFEFFCEQVKKNNVDFVFLYRAYTLFKVSTWKEIKHIANIHGVCLICVTPLHYPTWVQSGNSANRLRIDRASNHNFKALGDVPSLTTLGEHFDAKILVRPQGYSNMRGRAGSQEAALKELERAYKKNWWSKSDFEFSVSESNPPRENNASIFPATFTRRKGFDF